jgi:hypothetical protein
MMSSGRTDYSIIISLLVVLLAIGIPSLVRGQLFAGILCVSLIGGVAVWSVIEFRRRVRG